MFSGKKCNYTLYSDIFYLQVRIFHFNCNRYLIQRLQKYILYRKHFLITTEREIVI